MGFPTFNILLRRRSREKSGDFDSDEMSTELFNESVSTINLSVRMCVCVANVLSPRMDSQAGLTCVCVCVCMNVYGRCCAVDD